MLYSANLVKVLTTMSIKRTDFCYGIKIKLHYAVQNIISPNVKEASKHFLLSVLRLHPDENTPT